MNILLMGPQGSGKGTQARILIDKYGFYYFESGAYLRKISETNPEVKKWLAEGVLVPDKEMTSYLSAFLDQNNLYDNVIFDGFPRTVDQYHFWKNWLADKGVKLDLVIVLEISKDETIKRLSARREDPKTGVVYNLITEPPPADIDSKSLVQRDDDKPQAIDKRLSLYRAMTEPLITELRKDTKVVEINGERPVETIASEIDGIVADSK